MSASRLTSFIDVPAESHFPIQNLPYGVFRRRGSLSTARGKAAIGVAIGLAISLASSRLLAGLLFDVSPTDAATFAGVSVLPASAALLACYLPAWRAARVDPNVALRYE